MMVHSCLILFHLNNPLFSNPLQVLQIINHIDTAVTLQALTTENWCVITRPCIAPHRLLVINFFLSASFLFCKNKEIKCCYSKLLVF